MIPGTPPALSANPQFTPEYWDKVRRQQKRLKLLRCTKLNDGYTEFTFSDESAFQRKTEELNPEVRLKVNMQVYVETIKQLVTGMWVPEQGWVFRMTSDDLAEYTQKLVAMVNEERKRATQRLAQIISNALLEGLADEHAELEYHSEGEVSIKGQVSLDRLAGKVLAAMTRVRQE